MNYRHAYHAGNFADVVKHVLLTRILAHLLRKETPFRVVDTHAGIGLYDLDGDEASRSGERRNGIDRLVDPFPAEIEELLLPYRGVLAAMRDRHGPHAYPGSPAILREMIRPNDRAILVEKHPADATLLAARYNAVGNVKVVQANGWVALSGLIPPRERRGLVLIDPPFEEPDEWSRAPARLLSVLRKWPTGIVAFWYPIKRETSGDALSASLSADANTRLLRLELLVDASGGTTPRGGGALIGSGMIVANPPWTLATEARALLPALSTRLARGGTGQVVCCEMEP